MNLEKAILSLPLIVFCLLVCVSNAIAGEELSELMSRHWDAKWVSMPGRNLESYGVFHFRKKFSLEKTPESFIIHVSADNRYKLYVNGREVCDGPARGDLWHWRFETVDIAPYLRSGENLLAAVVWNFGEYVPWAQISHSTVFLVHGNSELEKTVNTDSSWKVAENTAYAPIPFHRDSVRHLTVVGPGERFDAERYRWGWQTEAYDDSDWKNAIEIGRATPRGMRDADSYWHLVPRNIPAMEKKPIPAPKIRRTDGAGAQMDSISGENTLTVPPHSKASIVLDQGELVSAYPKISMSGGAGGRMTVTYAEALVDKDGEKAHRDSIAGRFMEGFYDIILPAGGQDRNFETLWFRTYRYVGLDIETTDEPLSINSLKGIFVAYPFEENASFKSDDTSLQDIWEVSWRTARLCAGETYFDCPYYEQLQYVGDTRIQALVSLYVSGDDRLMRNAITQFDDSRISDGLTYSRYPTEKKQIIPPYSIFWIVMLHDYWMHCNDDRFVTQYMRGVGDVIDWFKKHLTGNDLLGNLPWWNFVDWVPEYEYGVPPGAEEGENAVISLQFVYALQMAEQLANALGMHDDAAHYGELASRVSAAVMKHCWSEERGLVAETPAKKQFSQQTNSTAILVDLFPPTVQKEVFERLVCEDDLVQCTFYYRYYLLQALKKVGEGDRYLDMLGPWYDMIDMGLTTFAEKPEPTRSDCHAWSASPIYELLATVCGIEPGSPGFATVRIEPHLGRLKFAECEMPHPLGSISCSFQRLGENGIEGCVTLPQGLRGEFFWQGKKIDLHEGKQSIYSIE